MKPGELRRLAIRLARYEFEEGGIFFVRCLECRGWAENIKAGTNAGHTPDCPIAELEAEEGKGEG